MIVGGIVFSGLLWLTAYFKRRAAKCPLCKGTPLLNSGAVPHPRARRIRPLNQGVSAMLSIMATQRFRCMYCGSDYDLLKPRSRRTYVNPPPAGDEAQRPHDA
jgi:DNA-directed RNA polymerase subunit RPC12/RpoP